MHRAQRPQRAPQELSFAGQMPARIGLATRQTKPPCRSSAGWPQPRERGCCPDAPGSLVVRSSAVKCSAGREGHEVADSPQRPEQPLQDHVGASAHRGERRGRFARADQVNDAQTDGAQTSDVGVLVFLAALHRTLQPPAGDESTSSLSARHGPSSHVALAERCWATWWERKSFQPRVAGMSGFATGEQSATIPEDLLRQHE